MEKGPPVYDLFDTMKKELGDKEVIAEDLGFLTPSVIKLVKKTGFPGMKILQFAFDSRRRVTICLTTILPTALFTPELTTTRPQEAGLISFPEMTRSLPKEYSWA